VFCCPHHPDDGCVVGRNMSVITIYKITFINPSAFIGFFKKFIHLINARNMERGVLFAVGRETTSRREIMRELDHAADSIEIRPEYIPNTRLEY